MTQSWKSRGVTVALACGVSAAALGAPAGAGEVRVEGHAVFFKAKLGEVNTVVVTHIAAGFDSPNPDVVRITDSATDPVAIPPCVKNGADTVVCEVQQPSFVSLDLGNKDDTASQTAVASPQSLPMKIFGGLGNDTLNGGFGADTIDGGPGVDTINGDDGDDVITGGAENDIIQGGRGADTIDGQLGNDTIDGGPGDDVIHGSAGDDTITGGAGSDKLFGDAGGDTLRSRDGEVDTVDCGIGNDTVDRDSNDSTKQCRR
jgi:Ca2+-binding RTX toxin-like protein